MRLHGKAQPAQDLQHLHPSPTASIQDTHMESPDSSCNNCSLSLQHTPLALLAPNFARTRPVSGALWVYALWVYAV
jgi:hypothetical protein